MTPELFKILAGAAIPFCGGVYVTLLGFRLIGAKPGENLQYDDWHKQWGRSLRVGGPFLIIGSIAMAIGRATSAF